MTLVAPAAAQTATGSVQAIINDYAIPAGRLSDVLAQFAAAAGVPLSFDPSLLAGTTSSGLRGRFSVEAGFAQLLRGSGYQAVAQPGGGYGLRRITMAGGAGAVALDAVEVTGKRESATGPVIGYAARRSATATRTDVPIREVPQAIQVIPSQAIEDQKALVLEDAVRNVSGVYRENTFGNTLDRFSLRGFRQDNFLRDGSRDAINGVRSLVGIERVEVLKGPASVVYGRLEPGGTVNLVSKRPRENPGHSAELQVGTYDHYRVTFDSTGPLNEAGDVLYRTDFGWQDAGTFRDATTVDRERIDFVPSLTWQISDRTALWAQLSYTRDEGPFDRGLVASGDQVADLPNDRFLGEPGDFYFSERYGFSLELTHELSDKVSTRQRWRSDWYDNEDYRAEPFGVPDGAGVLRRRFSGNDNHGFAHSLQSDLMVQLETGSISHDILVGLDLSREENGGTNARNNTFVPINIFAPVYGAAPLPLDFRLRDNRDTNDAYGVYFQDQVSLTDDVRLLAGLRYDSTRLKSRNFLTGTTTTSKDDALTRRLGLMWDIQPSLSVYLSYSEGFYPQTGGVLISGDSPEPTRSTQYELGLKGDLFDERLSATLAFYEITKEDVTTADQVNPGFVVQTGEIRSRGVELDIAGQLTPGWDLIASYAYTDAEITEDNSIPVGNRPFSVPRNGASLWSVYRFQSEAMRGWGLGGGVYHVGERYGDLANSFRLPSYSRVDATVFYEGDGWRAALNVKNLFDKDYIAAAQSRVRIDPGAPLTVLGSITWDF